jgi:hypothetical protein
MARSKTHVSPKHQEKHISRNGQNTTMKKMGAGMGNWGVLGDEIPDVEEYAHTFEIDQSKMDKVNIVDPRTFDEMRNE